MMFPSVNEQMDLIRQGTVEIIPENELVAKLEKSLKENIALNVKLGCDPSSPDLHIGHAVVLNKLKDFQDLGHMATLIIGDFTAMIGDPTGKKKTRPQLTFDETRINGQTYYEQAIKILDPLKLNIRYNSEWLSKLSVGDLITVLGKFTVQRILERDDFTKRLESEQEISMHELLYPIMQGYDSYAIYSDVELGGTDQKFNNLMGRDMQKRYGQNPQVVITMPLLEGTDGNEKMSKSLKNAIGLTDSPSDIFGKTMSIPDELIYKYYALGTRIDSDSLHAIESQLEEGVNPRDLKRKLGHEIVKLYHGAESADKAVDDFDKLFVKKEIPDEIPEYEITGDIKIVALLTESKMTESNAQARRLIEQGGVSINGEKITNANIILTEVGEFVLKAGKRKFLKIIRK